MTDLTLISGKPKIFVISSNEELIFEIQAYVEDYEYEFVGFGYDSSHIFERIDESGADLVFLDADIENVDLLELSGDLELFNIPILLIIGALFDETIDEILMSNPFGYLIQPLEKEELQRAMAVALKKHESNILTIKSAEAKIEEKGLELMIEKSDSGFLLILCISLILMALFTRNATWLQWVLIIPTLAMLINAIASFKRVDKAVPFPEDEQPFVSIFIPAHNEEFTIESTVRSVCGIEYNKNGEINYELIVVNDGSTDSTGEILAGLKKEYPQLKIVTRHPPRSGKGKGFVLNDALTLSRGEVIGVFDADTQVKPEFLTTVMAYLNKEGVEGVQSRVKMFNKNENFLARMQHVEFASFGNTLIAKDNLGYCGFLGGNGQFVYKQSIIDCGRWDGFAVTEDLNLAIKIILNGGKIRYCGDTAVYQEAVTDWGAFFRQRIRWAIGNFETLFIYFPQIIRSKIPALYKYNILEHISFYSFNLLIFFGFLITIANAISWFFFNNTTIIRMEAPFIIGFMSMISFFPGLILALSRDKPTILEFIKDMVKYYVYCFHLIPLFFMTMLNMLSRKERKWSKTVHKGSNQQ